MEKPKDHPRTASPYDLSATSKNRPSLSKMTNARDQSPYTLSRATSLRAVVTRTKKG